MYRFVVIKIGSLLRGVVKSAQRIPPSLLAHCLCTSLTKPILLSDPALPVYHSARSAGEISEVVLCHAIRKSQWLTSRKAVFPSKNANTSVVSFYCALRYVFKS